MGSAIDGVALTPLRIIPTQGGPVLHMLKAESPNFAGFGEIYFSEVTPGSVKGWKRHLQMRQNFAVPRGCVRFIIYDDRPGSPTRGMVQECLLGRPDHYRLLSMPPLLWYSFACVGEEPGLIANLTDLMHNSEESEMVPIDSAEASAFPYSWAKSRNGE
ncbi:MAG: dTDP-4-dehydrorhamnose 3,5-epimerase [Desulfovibrionaceae bacterium]|nr:dTDP-4-dehydrorhamnose 3,5-epimerase [Desulfovibrionaceae bacterium]